MKKLIGYAVMFKKKNGSLGVCGFKAQYDIFELRRTAKFVAKEGDDFIVKKVEIKILD